MPQRPSHRKRKNSCQTYRIRRTWQWESLEARALLAGDLVGHWRAEDLVATVADQGVVSSWTAASGVASTATGQPTLIHDALAGQAAVRFNAADGTDALRISANVSPVSNANDFSLVVAFATAATNLSGQSGSWFQNSGLVDGNSGGFGADWGLTINQAGKLSAGMGAGLGQPTTTIYSAADGYNDGKVHIATLTRSGGTLNLYVDNVLASSTSVASATARSQTDFAIGATASGNLGFTGDIAEVRVYNGQLTAGEVATVYGQLNSIYNNTAPVANPDSYSFPEDADFFNSQVAARGVLTNDTDAEGNTLTAVLVTPPAHGVVVLNANGSFVYDSDLNYFGPDSFTYSARDSQLSEPTTVSINVTPAYDPAVAQPDEYKVLAGTVLNVPLAGGVLNNDTNVDQATLQAQVVQNPAQGVLNLSANGSFTYNPQSFTGTATFTYRINDGTGLSNTATVAIVVNTPPAANNDIYQVTEDTTLNRTAAQGLVANDVDVDGNVVTVLRDSDVQHGTLTLSSDGAFSYRPNDNYFGTDSFTYHLSDTIDPSNVATVTLNVSSVNDVPIAGADSYSTTVDQPLTIAAANGILANDSDVESSPLTAALIATTTHGALTLNANGSFTYQPQVGYSGIDSFTYRASDGAGQSAVTTVSLSVASLDQLQQVLINEVHIDPDVKTELVEFIELTNRSAVAIDVSGWAFRNGIDYVLPSGSIIQPNGFLLVSENPAMFGTKFGRSAAGPWAGKLANSADTIELWTASGTKIDEVDYQLGFPWPTYGEIPGPSIQLLNPAFDNGVGGNWRSAVPTPGAPNSVLVANAAPQLRQVEHSPQLPKAGEPVVVTVRATDPDGVGAVNLQYQLVNPGDYIAESSPRYAAEWTSIAMHDDGQNGDTDADDGLYSVTLPASMQVNRRLVRYRISATDTPGASVTVPYSDDPVPNFAYYVYNGVPTWTGANDPATTAPVTYSSDLLNSIPVYQLITTRKDHVDSQFISDSTRSSGYTGSDYLWEGAMVYDGVVYDHINYRARGGVWRYAMGKNMWKFDFPRGHAFEARDNYGERYSTNWDKLNFSSVIQQGDFQHRGEQGLFESVGFELFNLAGVEAPNTHYVHFRIVESADETGTTQYNGDFQGLYLAVEQVDGNFLDEHELPDGNLYKIEGYAPESTSNQGATEPTGGRDVREFINASRSKQPGVDYWNENLNLQSVYSYQTIAHGIHHYDTQDGKNYYYFHNPDTGLWQIVPWDLDLTWADNMYGGEGHQLNTRVAKFDGFNNYTNQANIDLKNRFNYDYQNRVRELLDLLYNQEQTGMLIDQMAGFVYQPGELSFVDADRAMWDANPINNTPRTKYTNDSKNNTNRTFKYYQKAATKDYAGMIKILKDYIENRTTALFMRTILSNEANIPTKPALTYTGPGNYPTDSLSFRSTNFASPIGATFSAMKWRIAEVTDPNAPGFDPFDTTTDRSYEITSTWESDVLTSFDANMTIPGEKLQPGKTYRVRVRMQDNDGHWSHWSDPVQFIASTGVDNDLAAALRVSELNYNPGAASGAEAAAGFSDNNDFEFIELMNISGQTIDLTAASLDTVVVNGADEGIDFSFADGAITQMAPGGRILVVENQAAFEMRYGSGLPVAGEWTGRLSNSGETITLSAYGSLIQQFVYDDNWHVATDGDGATLEIVDATNANLAVWGTAAGWKATQANGTPGVGDGVAVPGDSNRDGIFNSADLAMVFQNGEYEDNIADNSNWEDGDWNGDQEFNTADFVYAFTAGTYVAAALPVQRQRTPTSPVVAAVTADEAGDLDVAELAAAVDEVFGTRNWEQR